MHLRLLNGKTNKRQSYWEKSKRLGAYKLEFTLQEWCEFTDFNWDFNCITSSFKEKLQGFAKGKVVVIKS